MVACPPLLCYNDLITCEEDCDMNLGNSLFSARKKSGMSQEEVAERLLSMG